MLVVKTLDLLVCLGFACWNHDKFGLTCIPVRQVHWVGLGQGLNHLQSYKLVFRSNRLLV